MMIVAFVCFIALVAAWMLAPNGTPVVETTTTAVVEAVPAS